MPATTTAPAAPPASPTPATGGPLTVRTVTTHEVAVDAPLLLLGAALARGWSSPEPVERLGTQPADVVSRACTDALRFLTSHGVTPAPGTRVLSATTRANATPAAAASHPDGCLPLTA